MWARLRAISLKVPLALSIRVLFTQVFNVTILKGARVRLLSILSHDPSRSISIHIRFGLPTLMRTGLHVGFSLLVPLALSIRILFALSLLSGGLGLASY